MKLLFCIHNLKETCMGGTIFKSMDNFQLLNDDYMKLLNYFFRTSRLNCLYSNYKVALNNIFVKFYQIMIDGFVQPVVDIQF